MMELEQKVGSFLAQGQTAVRTVLPPSTRGVVSELLSRFQGEGVRYKAKLIGMDVVPDAQGDKMCWDSMMKLKGIEVAGRRQGKHKQRVWLKVLPSGLKILDERTGAVLYDHDRSRISSLQKDESDPRALSYIYRHEDTYILFYIRTATLADPVLADIETVCRGLEHETPQEHPQAPTHTSPPLLLNDVSAPPAEGPALENIFSPPDSSSGPSHQASSTNELMEIFSPKMESPMVPSQSLCTSQPESPQLSCPPTLSSSQILSMFPTQPVGGSPYSSPTYPPTNMPWGQQGLVGNQWAGPAGAPWPPVPNGMQAWAPIGLTALPAGGQVQGHDSQPGTVSGGNTPTSPTAVNECVDPLDSLWTGLGASGATVPVQPAPPTLNQNLI
ncbi:disabled homolog 2-like [Sparus aurata]|uniref:disabled homolog 2-like n=1 Tax=Sparus aurata TaxID=8175 RepID=UPI0011C149F1|nr:disabled homolog 2-like [Sparus aurata]XP_030288176.1 disabled homolog 2-like [Sparus aurata]